DVSSTVFQRSSLCLRDASRHPCPRVIVSDDVRRDGSTDIIIPKKLTGWRKCAARRETFDQTHQMPQDDSPLEHRGRFRLGRASAAFLRDAAADLLIQNLRYETGAIVEVDVLHRLTNRRPWLRMASGKRGHSKAGKRLRRRCSGSANIISRRVNQV